MATVRRTTKVEIPTLLQKVRVGRRGVVAANEPGRFGVYGGRYVPETLIAAVVEHEREQRKAKRERKFQARLEELLRTYKGGEKKFYFELRLTEKLGGAKIYLKREDLLHAG